ncbi:serine/threonine-protein kinase [Undibacterium arcticum]|uniref:Serine/threonine-protein kinase n=1 Tax=Undibacterium arcticum TaxID=1762892 RepID=A0ABV7F550_9BURK
MANFAQAIRAFQSSALSQDDFFAQVDRVLTTEQSSSAHLLEILGEEHTKIPLPHDVYAEVQRRIERFSKSTESLSADETHVRTKLDDRAALPSATVAPNHQSVAAPDRIKGVGDTLNGRFVLEECIGFGGMGTVYRALDLRKLEASDRKPYIAIKVLNVPFSSHPKSLIALQREARKAQTLAHPNIVTVYDFDRDGSMVYLTMEYLSGKPLSQTLRMPGFTGMPYAEALRIVNGMGKALAYAHDRGFVHCDFKPANVIVTDKGELKVIDFGIARVFHKPEEDVEATVFDAGSLGGLTPAYASPEMLEHCEPDPRDDIYALACITYELLTGRHPFDRLSATQARSAGIRPQRPKNIGHRQWRALKAALSFDRETRTPTVTRFLQEMSVERQAARYIAPVTSSLVLGLLVAAALYYYWDARTGIGQRSDLIPPPAPIKNVPQATPQTAPPAVLLSIASIKPILARVPCSALAPAVHDHALRVQGYIPKSFGIARLKDMLGAAPGVQTLNLDVQQVSDYECDVINTFAPYWAMNQQAGRVASIHVRGPSAELTEGDPLIVDITTPGYDSYVYVDYYVLDGNVAHLVPNLRTRGNQAPPNYTATVGSLGNWVIAKPFGTELIVLVTTPVALFDGVGPEYESRSDYLRAIEKKLGPLATKYGRERIMVDFVQITTKTRNK